MRNEYKPQVLIRKSKKVKKKKRKRVKGRAETTGIFRNENISKSLDIYNPAQEL